MSKINQNTPQSDVRWYKIPLHEFLRATESDTFPEGMEAVGRMAIREASQLVVSNLSDKLETILLGVGAWSVYHFADINKIHTFHDVFDNPARSVGVAVLVGTGGRLIFLGLTKPIIKSIRNTQIKTRDILKKGVISDEK